MENTKEIQSKITPIENPPSLSISQARYLKHSGKEIDVKVTIKIRAGSPVIYIRDFEFFTFHKALLFLRHIVETELVSYSGVGVRS